MAEKNSTILDRITLEGSSDYQQRVPLTKSHSSAEDGVAAVVNALTAPGNGQLWNEFENKLVTLIGNQIVRDQIWSNPLAEFKDEANFRAGKDAQELGALLQNALQYDPEANNFLKRHKLDIKTAFYGVNRRVAYPVTVNQAQIKRSFNTDEGLNRFLALALSTVILSNQYDEYRFMLDVFAKANQKYPFFNVNVAIADTDAPTEAELKALSTAIRTLGLKFTTAPSTYYNSFGLPAVSRTEDLVLLTTPTIKASLEVNVLADAFNWDKADINSRVILVDELPWAGAHAVLLDKRAIVAGDSMLELHSTGVNPRSLETTYYLHAQGGYAISPMVNVAVFSNATSSNIGVVEVELQDINASFKYRGKEVSTVKPGTESVKLFVEAIGDIEGDDAGIFKVPGGFTSTVEIEVPSGSDWVDEGRKTYVKSNGSLVVPSDIPVGSKIEVTVTASYINPSADINSLTTAVTATAEITVAKTIEYVTEEEEETPETPGS